MNQRSLNADDVGPHLYQVFNEISIIAQLAGRAMERALPDGLSLAGYGVLNHFVRLDRAESPSRLAAAFQVTKGAMTNTLRRLEDKGLVELVKDPADARAKLVLITDKGRTTHTKCLKRVSPFIESVSDELDPDRLIGLLPTLRELRVFLDEARNSVDFPELVLS